MMVTKLYRYYNVWVGERKFPLWRALLIAKLFYAKFPKDFYNFLLFRFQLQE